MEPRFLQWTKRDTFQTHIFSYNYEGFDGLDAACFRHTEATVRSQSISRSSGIECICIKSVTFGPSQVSNTLQYIRVNFQKYFGVVISNTCGLCPEKAGQNKFKHFPTTSGFISWGHCGTKNDIFPFILTALNSALTRIPKTIWKTH